jgi:two-component sensor histidine kinase
MVCKDKSLLIGQPLYIIYKKETQEEVFRQYKNNHLSESLQVRIEREIELWNGEIIDVELSNSFIRLSDNNRVVLSIFRDITERKKMEEQLIQAIKEKEVMLSEIHHRVKNNMQIISSLLKLQSEKITDPLTREYFQISQNRVNTMALIHEQLYKSTELSKIDFEKYIRQLAFHLFQTYGVNTEQCALRINVVDIYLSIDVAIPCGLLINELISNSLKHAFTLNSKGEIYIGLTLDLDNMYTLIVSDNGVGLPPDIDYRETKTLGLRLIATLSKQLQGEIQLNRERGTEFKITFPSIFYKKRV